MEYQLKNEDVEVKFHSVGGTFTSIKKKSAMEYLWQGDPAYWSGQAPVLFPICGSIRNDKAIIGDGLTTSMPRHGIVRKLEFNYEGQTEDSITFSIESNPELYEKFPYHFKLYTQYKIEGSQIQVTYIVENKDEKSMPFFIGGHPGFNCPLSDGEVYEDYLLEFEQKEKCTVPTPVTSTGLIDIEARTPFLNNQKELQLSQDMFSVDAVILDELKSRKVKMYSQKSGHGVEVEFEDFPYLILWSTANKGPFLAIEPWVGLSTCSDESDRFEEKRNVQMVNSGEKKEYTYTIRVF